MQCFPIHNDAICYWFVLNLKDAIFYPSLKNAIHRANNAYNDDHCSPLVGWDVPCARPYMSQCQPKPTRTWEAGGVGVATVNGRLYNNKWMNGGNPTPQTSLTKQKWGLFVPFLDCFEVDSFQAVWMFTFQNVSYWFTFSLTIVAFGMFRTQDKVGSLQLPTYGRVVSSNGNIRESYKMKKSLLVALYF